MRRIAHLSLIAVIILVSLNAFVPAHLVKKPTDNSHFTAQVMNCKPGMYKTYEDFVNNKPQPWKWTNMDVGYTLQNTYAKFLVVFKDENGKKVKLSPGDFWGFRVVDGPLYRNGNFESGNVTHIPFKVDYVAKDFVYYNPPIWANVRFSEYNWFSSDLNSPIVGKDSYFEDHDKTSFVKMGKDVSACVNGSKSEILMDKCRCQSPEVMCIWKAEKPDGSKGSYVK